MLFHMWKGYGRSLAPLRVTFDGHLPPEARVRAVHLETAEEGARGRPDHVA